MSKDSLLRERAKFLKRGNLLRAKNTKLSWKIIRLLSAKRIPLSTIPFEQDEQWSLIYKYPEQYYPLGISSYLEKNLRYCKEQNEINRFHMLLLHMDHISYVSQYHNRRWRRAISSGMASGHNKFTAQLLKEYEECFKEVEKIFNKNWVPLSIKEWKYFSEQMLKGVFTDEEIERMKEIKRNRRKKKKS